MKEESYFFNMKKYQKRLEEFYKGKRVLVTGHTGFKGSWLCRILTLAGAEVTGYSLNPPTDPSLFEIAGIGTGLTSVIGDVRDLEHLEKAFEEARPEIVFHLAAQPIVRDSYKDPVYTYETNVMGTVHVLECIRRSGCVLSFLNVTTDKVYENREWEYGYRETDPLEGSHLFPGDETAGLIADIPRESLRHGRYVTFIQKIAGEMGPGPDGFWKTLFHDFPCDGDFVFRQKPDHLAVAHVSGIQEPGKASGKVSVVHIDVQSQDMDIPVFVTGGKLDAGDQHNPKLVCFLAGRGDSPDGIVVRQRDGGQPFFCCVTHHLPGRQRPVGAAGVDMQVDIWFHMRSSPKNILPSL